MKYLYIKLSVLFLVLYNLSNAQIVTTLAGNTASGSVDGTDTTARFNGPLGAAVDGNGNLYVADTYNNEIRKIVISTGVVTTIAGSTTVGSANGIGTAASFRYPQAIALDKNGNLYIADVSNNEIRVMNLTSGQVTTLAGSTTHGSNDGIGTAASFYEPRGLAIDDSNNLYVADNGNNEIRKIVISTGAVTTVAGSTTPGSVDGTGLLARFSSPEGLAIDSNGILYITDFGNAKIRTMVLATGVVSTLAGSSTSGTFANGIGSAAGFYNPSSVATDGRNVYVADTHNNLIRKIVIATDMVTTFAGSYFGPGGFADGIGSNAKFYMPTGIAEDASGTLYVTDEVNNRIRKVAQLVPPITYFKANDSIICQGTTVQFTDTTHNYHSNWNWTFQGGTPATSTVQNPAVLYKVPGTYSVKLVTSSISTTDSLTKQSYIRVNPDPVANISTTTTLCTGVNDTLTANASGTSPFTYNWSTKGTNDTIILSPARPSNTSIVTTIAGEYNAYGAADGIGTAAIFDAPYGVASDGNGNLFVTDWLNNEIRKIVLSTGAVSTFAGTQKAGSADGIGTAASFNGVSGIVYDGSGNLFVTDFYNHEIRKVVISTGAVTTFAGSTTFGTANGIGTAAKFHNPYGITIDGNGNLFVADDGNNEIRQVVIATTAVTTLAGNINVGFTDGIGTAASFWGPIGVTTDGIGNLYVTDPGNREIRKIVISSATVTTLAGNHAVVGYTDGIGTAATFWTPIGITYDGSGNLYITDEQVDNIRKINLTNDSVSTIAGIPFGGNANGFGTVAGFDHPMGITYVGNGNLYLADQVNEEIRQVSVPVAFSVTVTDANGCSTTTDIHITVNTKSLATPIGTSNIPCYGGTIDLAALSTGATSYSWTGPNGFSANNQTTVITGATYADTGTYSVIASNGCGISTPGIVKVIIDSGAPKMPTITCNNPVCPGATLNLSANSATATAYNWAGPNGFSGSIQNPSVTNVTVAAAGVYSVTATNGCGTSITDTITVKVAKVHLPLTVTATPDTLCPGASSFLNATGADTYRWSTGATTPTIISTPTYNTIYDVIGRSGTCSDTATITVYLANDLGFGFSIEWAGASCPGICNGSAIVTGNGGNPPYKYLWSTGSTYDTINNLCPGIFSVIIMDSAKCGFADTLIFRDTAKVFGANGFDLAGNLQVCIDTPSFNSVSIQACIFNNHCLSVNGSLKLMLDTAIHITSTVSDSITRISGDTLIWNYDSLSETGKAHCVSLNGTVSNIPPGDSIFVKMLITPLKGDSVPSNNNIFYWVKAKQGNCLGSPLDPNEKSVYPIGDIADTQKLTYTIHFQNTGTTVAHNVVVIDTLSTFLDIATLTELSSSNLMNIQVASGHVVKFIFNNINLPDTAISKTTSAGVFSFTIKPMTTVTPGDKIINKADIYFDNNPVIITNKTVNTITVIASVQNIVPPVNIICFPNPFITSTSIIFNTDGKHYLELDDITGRKIEAIEFTGRQYELQRNNLAPGVYFIKAFNADKDFVATSKLVAQ